ncbi:hypothetical protein [Arthrobacter sp. 35W]|uniref:hypothetical protein n=1 Tax=Arthrobacter sp. 35W TaxID=1132441 RepID=UPI000685DE33|nr:hypothetical protein [Arthrobacter sp. 35W]
MTQNPDTPQPVGSRPPAPSGPSTGGKTRLPLWLRRTILVAVLVAIAAAILSIGAVVAPVWWADTIGNQVQGNLGAGILVGMFYGFVFSLLPVVVGWQAHYKGMNKWVRISILVAAVLLATPNLLTLAVLNGTSKSAHDAQRILSVEANWFGIWSVWFMVLGVLAGVVALQAGRIWRRRGEKVRAYKAVEAAKRKVEEAEAREARDAEKAAAKAARDAARKERGQSNS